VDGEKEIGAFAVRQRGALFERHEDVRIACHHDVHAGLLLEQPAEPKRDVERQLRFVDPRRLGTGIVAPVPRVDDDARDPETELPRERKFSVGIG
jgi:hypothetical protein